MISIVFYTGKMFSRYEPLVTDLWNTEMFTALYLA